MKYKISIRNEHFNDSFLEKLKNHYIPTVNLGDSCICCNKPSSKKVDLDPGGRNEIILGEFKAPVCNECEHHAYSKNVFPTSYYVFGISLLYIIAHLFYFNLHEADLLLIVGGIILILSFFTSRNAYLKRRINSDGHNPNFKIWTGQSGELFVSTENKLLVERIINLNNDKVVIVKE